MVPEGWEKHLVGKICSSIVPGRNKPKEFSGSIPWVTTPEIKGRYIPSKYQQNFISAEALKECGGKIGDVSNLLKGVSSNVTRQ